MTGDKGTFLSLDEVKRGSVILGNDDTRRIIIIGAISINDRRTKTPFFYLLKA